MAATASWAEWRPRSSWVQTLETIFCFFQVIRKELSISILLRSGIHFGSTAILTVHSQTLNLNFNCHLKVTSLSLDLSPEHPTMEPLSPSMEKWPHTLSLLKQWDSHWTFARIFCVSQLSSHHCSWAPDWRATNSYSIFGNLCPAVVNSN